MKKPIKPSKPYFIKQKPPQTRQMCVEIVEYQTKENGRFVQKYTCIPEEISEQEMIDLMDQNDFEYDLSQETAAEVFRECFFAVNKVEYEFFDLVAQKYCISNKEDITFEVRHETWQWGTFAEFKVVSAESLYKKELEEYEKEEEKYQQELKQYKKDLEKYKVDKIKYDLFMAQKKVEALQKTLDSD